MTTPRLPITVVVPVRNEEAHLQECLGRLGRFERVVVVDSHSDDRTAEVATGSGAEVVQFRWDGRFPKKRNWFLRNHPPATPWVLFLDADELVDDRFCDELAQVLPGSPHAGYWLTYDNWFMGRRLLHGTPNRKLALFRTGAGEYERIEEELWSPLDMEIHEHPVIQGSTGVLHTRIDHRDDRGLAHWLRRHVDYAVWEAHRCADLRSRGPGWERPLTKRQRAKYRNLGKWWLPPAVFVTEWIVRRGALDGRQGLAYALLKAWYFWTIGQLLRQRPSR